MVDKKMEQNDELKAVVMQTKEQVRYGEVLDVVRILFEKQITNSRVCVLKNNKELWLDMNDISLK